MQSAFTSSLANYLTRNSCNAKISVINLAEFNQSYTLSVVHPHGLRYIETNMDIAENLELDYEEQCFMQIDKLSEELLQSEKKEPSYGNSYRLFRNNLFEDMDSERRQHLEKLLTHTLRSIGEHVKAHLIDLSRACDPINSPTTGEEVCPGHGPTSQVLCVNRGKKSNFLYDKDGVIHLKPKDQIQFSIIGPSKQSLMLHLVAKVLQLLETDTYMTKRELFYKSLEFCKTKKGPSKGSRLDSMLDDLCCLAGCSKVHLHILTQSKGVVYGDLKFRLKNGEYYECFKNEGVLIPTPQSPIVEMTSDAKFIIVLEKDSIMQKILNLESTSGFVKRYKVILFTAKGYPDVNSRAFLNFLWTKLRIPILAFTDADPHGLEIVCCYKFGCYATAHEGARLAVPHIKWLGLLPEEVTRRSLPESKTKPLSSSDLLKINSLLARPYIKNRQSWCRQLIQLKTIGKKAELEALDIDGEYLVTSYLPNKLRYASWL